MGTFTLKTIPQAITPVGNQIIYSAEYTSPSTSGFKYLCNIYVNDEFITKLKKQPTNLYSQFFDVSGIVRNNITYDFNPSVHFITPSGDNSLKELKTDLGYRTTASGDTITSGQSVIYIFNGYLDRNEFLNYDCNDYVANNVTYSKYKYLTDYQERVVRLTDEGTLSTFNFFKFGATPYSSQVTGFRILTDNGNIFTIKNVHSGGTTLSENRLDIPCYPSNIVDLINSNTGITYWNGTSNAQLTSDIFQDYSLTISGNLVAYKATKYYTIYSMNGSNINSLGYKFTVNNDCNMNDVVQVAWLNKFGAFDFISFDGATTEEYSFERKTYAKNLGEYNQSTFTYDYSSTDFEILQFNTIESKQITVNTNWLTTDNELNRVLELISSPVIYVNVNGTWEPKLITNNPVVKPNKKQKLVSYNIVFAPTYKQQKQKF